MLEMAVVLLIFAATLAFVGWPLFEPALAGDGPSTHELHKTDLQDEKERLFSALRDLEHDHATGKIDDADHASLSASLKVDAARVLKEIDVSENKRVLRDPSPASPPTTGEKALAKQLDEIAERVNAPDTRFCTKCGKQARDADAFCGRCGSKLE